MLKIVVISCLALKGDRPNIVAISSLAFTTGGSIKIVVISSLAFSTGGRLNIAAISSLAFTQEVG
jgi:hypothetical protein